MGYEHSREYNIMMQHVPRQIQDQWQEEQRKNGGKTEAKPTVKPSSSPMDEFKKSVRKSFGEAKGDETYYVDQDSGELSTGDWYVFDSSKNPHKAVSSWSDKSTAQKEADKLNKLDKLVKLKNENHMVSLVSPMGMLVTTSPSVPAVPATYALSAKTSPGTDNGHVHTASYDTAGNGVTDDVDGHCHTIRGFLVAPHQTTDGGLMHSHPGLLPRQDEQK